MAPSRRIPVRLDRTQVHVYSWLLLPPIAVRTTSLKLKRVLLQESAGAMAVDLRGLYAERIYSRWPAGTGVAGGSEWDNAGRNSGLEKKI